MAGNAGAVILIAPLLFDAAARPQRAARLVVRAEAEAAAAPKAAPKKEVGPKRGSTVRAAAATRPLAQGSNHLQDRSCNTSQAYVKRQALRHPAAMGCCARQEQQAVPAAL
jgi:hypothetical protein